MAIAHDSAVPGEHEAQPHPQGVRDNRGRRCDAITAALYPLFGDCGTCDMPVTLTSPFGDWAHDTGPAAGARETGKHRRRKPPSRTRKGTSRD